MGNEVEIRVDAISNTGLEVYFWQNGQRGQVIHLFGGEDEVRYEGTFITESVCAWAQLMLKKESQSEKDEAGWKVMYKTNVVGGDIIVALEKVQQRIEMAIQKGMEVQMDITDDLTVPGWIVEAICDD